MILVKKSLLHPKSQCVYSFVVITISLFHEISSIGMIHYLENKLGVVDFANAQGLVMF